MSAWACANRLVLAQVAVPEGSNEIPALPALPRLLVLKGCIVTIDAIGCQDRAARWGIKARRLKAALSPAYLLATLNGSF